jgi:hypothetical protein
MSTFGKKALIWWDYHKRDRVDQMRFNSTPKDLQLKILEKWYPVGMMVGLGDGKYQYVIVEYVDHSTYWSVRVIWRLENSLMNNMKSNRNPLSLFPSPDWEKQIKRQHKLDRIV